MEYDEYPSTQKEAKELGTTFFFTGKQCKHGHTAKRFTSNYVCYECYLGHGIKYKKENKEKINAYKRKWRKENKDLNSEYDKKSYYKNREKRIQKSINWRNNNREMFAKNRYKAEIKRKRLVNDLAYYPEDKELLDFIIKEALSLRRMRKRLTGIDWHLDHIVPLNSKIVCGLHTECNLQMIPALENMRKSNLYWPDMP